MAAKSRKTKHKDTKTAVGYVRVSTAGQAEEGTSLSAQKAKIRAWADLNDYELLSIHSDEGISGKKMDNRPGLQRALSKACKAKGCLVVYSLSRLARSTRDAIDISDRVAKCGADLASLSEQINTASASGKLFFRLMAALGEFESDVISERTSAALQHKRSKGERVSRFAPFGSDFNDAKTKLVPNATEQAVIRKMNRWREKGLSYGQIAARLEGKNIPAKRGPKWYAKTVRDTLNRFTMPAA